MPPKGYASVSIKKEVYEKLEKLRISLGFGSVSNLLSFLVEFYISSIERRNEINEIMKILRKCFERSSKNVVEGG